MRDFPLKTGGNRAELHYYLIISVATSSWDLRHHQNNTTVHHSKISSSSRHFPWIGREAHRRHIATESSLSTSFDFLFWQWATHFFEVGFWFLETNRNPAWINLLPFLAMTDPCRKPPLCPNWTLAILGHTSIFWQWWTQILFLDTYGNQPKTPSPCVNSLPFCGQILAMVDPHLWVGFCCEESWFIEIYFNQELYSLFWVGTSL